MGKKKDKKDKKHKKPIAVAETPAIELFQRGEAETEGQRV